MTSLYTAAAKMISFYARCRMSIFPIYISGTPTRRYYTGRRGAQKIRMSYSREAVQQIYGGVSQSQNAFCFLIEANGTAIGECWFQKMNLPDVKAMYAPSLDVRRIDMCIGEKAYWGCGIGTQFIGMMVDFAFNGEHADVLHCICEDYNIRSRRVWEKNGFTQILSVPIPQPQKGKLQLHYRLTRQETIHRRRYRPKESDIFRFPITSIQPSQLFVSEGKLRNVREWFDPSGAENFDPIPLKELCGKLVMTDGHTRAVAAHLAGWTDIPVYMDTDELDWNFYETNVKWCEEAGIHTPAALAEHIVSHKDYEHLWRRRCMEMAEKRENQ